MKRANVNRDAQTAVLALAATEMNCIALADASVEIRTAAAPAVVVDIDASKTEKAVFFGIAGHRVVSRIVIRDKRAAPRLRRWIGLVDRGLDAVHTLELIFCCDIALRNDAYDFSPLAEALPNLRTLNLSDVPARMFGTRPMADVTSLIAANTCLAESPWTLFPNLRDATFVGPRSTRWSTWTAVNDGLCSLVYEANGRVWSHTDYLTFPLPLSLTSLTLSGTVVAKVSLLPPSLEDLWVAAYPNLVQDTRMYPASIVFFAIGGPYAIYTRHNLVPPSAKCVSCDSIRGSTVPFPDSVETVDVEVYYGTPTEDALVRDVKTFKFDLREDPIASSDGEYDEDVF